MITLEQIGNKDIIIFNEDTTQLITNFEPYFYVEDINGSYISLFGEKCKKIITKKPTDVRDQREKYGKHFEADIPYRERFLIDRISIPIPKANLHILYFDIETNMSVDSEKAPEPITCITAYSTKLKKYISFVWRVNCKKEKKIIAEKWDSYYFNDETEMLEKFFQMIKNINPHILTGWNIEQFDLTYIINRSKKLNIPVNKISPLGKVFVNKFQDVRIYGRVVFDLLNAYKKLHQNIMESYSLEAISKKELNDCKVDIELENLWQNNLNKLLEYNKKDVELCKKIDERLGIIDFFDEQRREIGCLWESLLMPSRKHDVALLREAKEKGIILPSKKKQDRDTFKGAIVLEPEVGIHENVICLDVKSLYPSVICQFNMSLETIGGKEVILPNGVTFSVKKQGFIVGVLKKYFEKRKYYKNLMNQYQPDSPEYKINFNKQWSYKIMLTSLYGYLGYVKARLFNYDVAKSITYMSRLVLLHMKSIVEKEGYKVIAGDTDSLFVKMKSDNLEENINAGKYLTNIINLSFDNFVQQFFCEKNEWLEVEFEKLNRRMFFSISEEGEKAVKKRYAEYCIWIKK